MESGQIRQAQTEAERPARRCPDMPWAGWDVPVALPGQVRTLLAEFLGTDLRPSPSVPEGDVVLAPSRLSADAVAAFTEAAGSGQVHTGRTARLRRAGGKSTTDLLRRRAGDAAEAPDAVITPGTHDEVVAVLAAASRHQVAVIPFGGGTSVTGGVEPLRDGFAAAVALDLRRLDRLTGLDPESLTATLQAGLRGPEAEELLGRHGLTLGHLPQSFEHATIGGFAATRSAGQASTGYGGIEKMVLGLRLAAPAGEIELPPLPASAAGPGLRQLLVGSEGTLGVITELSLRVRRAPQARAYEGVFFESFDQGREAFRALAAEHALPDVARLSDEAETRMSLALAGSGGAKGALGRRYLALRGYAGGCLAIVGFEGGEWEVSTRRRRALHLLRRAGGLVVGSSPGRAWREGRFAAPYLRDELLGLGVMAETLETATQWSNVGRLHEAVSGAIERELSSQGTPGLVMCHVSHVYESGASLYFTFLARQKEGAEIEQWRAVKSAASEAIVAGGGTITHHHAVGRDHAPWMEREIGAEGLAALRAVKAELDPAGVMNPGKLL